MKKKTIIMYILGIILSFSVNIIPGRTEHNIAASSGNHSKIFLDGNTALDDFCAGNGTDGLSWETAHIIEDMIIDAELVDSPIEIKYTDRYLIIQNCTLSKSERTGGGLWEATAGIRFTTVENVKIQECVLNNNEYAIKASDSSNLIISNNTITNCVASGMLFSTSTSSIIENCLIDSSGWEGILLYSACEFFNISGNIITNNGFTEWIGVFLGGIALDRVSNNNRITNNIIDSNIRYGVFAKNSDNNLISGNNITNNGEYGVMLTSLCDNNEVSDNKICNHTEENIQDITGNNNLHDNDFCEPPPPGIPGYGFEAITVVSIVAIAMICFRIWKTKRISN